MCGYVYYKSNASNLFSASKSYFSTVMNIGCAFSLTSKKSLHAMHKNVFLHHFASIIVQKVLMNSCGLIFFSHGKIQCYTFASYTFSFCKTVNQLLPVIRQTIIGRKVQHYQLLTLLFKIIKIRDFF